MLSCVHIAAIRNMIKGCLILVLIFTVSCPVSGQETSYGQGFQTIMVNNPSYTGTGEGIMRLSYLNFYPGSSYNFHSVYFSYDSYYPALHGGAGLFISDDYLGGIVNDVRGGISYSYFLQAGREFYINAGLTASAFHRGFNFNNAVLPEQIDQLGGISIPPSEILNNKSRTVFDIGTGFLFIYRNFFGGFGISHLAEPDLGGDGASADRLKRKYFINAIAEYYLDKKNNLKIKPLTAFEIQENYLSVSMGTIIESNYLSVNTLIFYNTNRNIDLQAGFSLKSGRISLFYNYKINLSAGNSLMPFSLMHHTGLAFSLNNVEKRISGRTINIPLL
ncbi:MAG: PorP/SprF family type IX secretion system membrane protein [Bacteroidales bacterium]